MIDQLREIGTRIRGRARKLRRKWIALTVLAALGNVAGATTVVNLLHHDRYWVVTGGVLLITIWCVHWQRDAFQMVDAINQEMTRIDERLAALDGMPEIFNRFTFAEFMQHIYPDDDTEEPNHENPAR